MGFQVHVMVKFMYSVSEMRDLKNMNIYTLYVNVYFFGIIF